MVLLAVVPTKLIQLCATAHRLIPVTTLSLTAGSLTRVQICRAAPLSVVGKIVPVPFGLVGVEDLDEAVVTVLVSCYVGVTRLVIIAHNVCGSVAVQAFVFWCVLSGSLIFFFLLGVGEVGCGG